jgi:miniconductance mechanosensitive channel
MNFHEYALTLLREITKLLQRLKLAEPLTEHLDLLVYLLLILLSAFLLERIFRTLFRLFFRRILKHKEVTLLNRLMQHKAFHRITSLIPPLWMGLMLPVAFTQDDHLLLFLERLVWISFCVALTLSINSILSSVQETLLTHATLHDRPIKGIIQLLQVGFVCLLVILILSILFNRSPLHLLAGLSAFAAVLILVFRDTLLGFVSGVLLSQNDMVRMGDWIELKESSVNGIVIDISLTIVKVRNFDNTIATIPPYQLISSVFINWRAMKESPNRLLYLIIYLKAESIHPYTSEPMQTSTNLTLFRAHLLKYLLQHPQIDQNPKPMVYLGCPTPYGVPLQIFCYTPQKNRDPFFAVQSEVIDYMMAQYPQFGLVMSESSYAASTNFKPVTSSFAVN